MAQWVYEARDGAGKVVRGTHDAADRRTALEFLRAQGLFLTRLEAGQNSLRPRIAAPTSPSLPASGSVPLPRSTGETATPSEGGVEFRGAEKRAPNGVPIGVPVGVPPARAVAGLPTAPTSVTAGPGRVHSAAAGEAIPNQPLLRASTKELSIYFRQMGAMIHAGTSLGAALHSMVESAPNGALRHASAQMERRTLGGEPLAISMAAFPGLFTPLQIGMVGAGERGGLLDSMFARLARYAERDYDLQQTIKSETWYPKLLVFCCILIPGSVPLIVAMIQGTKFPWAALMTSVGIPLLLVGAAFGAAKLWKFMVPLTEHKSGIKGAIDNIKLKTPVAGKVVRAFATAKFCRALGALYGAGVGPGESVRLAAGACGNAAIAQSAREIIPRLEHGESLTDSLASTGHFPITVLQVMRVGEMSGNLDDQLDKSADFLETDAEVAVKQAVKVMGVLVLVLMGAVVGSQVIHFWMNYFDAAFNMGEKMAE